MTAPNEPSPTIREMLTAIVRRQVPWLFLAGLHTFRVAAVSGGRVDLEPSRTRMFGPQRGVYQWPGVAGAEGTPQVGSEVVLAFLDNDSNRPALVSFTPLRGDLGVPDAVKVDASGSIDLGEHASEVHVKTDFEVDGNALVSGDSYLGGLGATSLAHAQEIVTWAALVVTTVNQCATYINGIAPGTVTPLAALSPTVTASKAKGV